jgi:Domain of unknown function (DUF4129)
VTALQLSGGARADSLRTAVDAVFAGPSYDWTPVPDPWAPVRRAWNALLDWIDRLREGNPAGYRLLVGALVAVLLGVLLHAAWVAVRTIRAGSRREDEAPKDGVSTARDAAWYAGEVERLVAAGRWVDAMQADFVRLVLQLDARRLVRFHPSRTPSEYAREPALDALARDELRALVRTLYAHAFAHVPADRATFDAWRARAAVDRYAPAH